MSCGREQKWVRERERERENNLGLGVLGWAEPESETTHLLIAGLWWGLM